MELGDSESIDLFLRETMRTSTRPPECANPTRWPCTGGSADLPRGVGV